MKVWEQYKGSGGPHEKVYKVGGGFGTHDASNYYAINDKSGQPLGGKKNPYLAGSKGGGGPSEVATESADQAAASQKAGGHTINQTNNIGGSTGADGKDNGGPNDPPAGPPVLDSTGIFEKYYS